MDFEPIETDAQGTASFLNYARLRRQAREERDADVGDAVHFWDEEAARCRAAVVTQDDLATVELTIWPPGDGFRSVRATGVKHDETKAGSSWHWPCGGH